jgi:hypothetical protein
MPCINYRFHHNKRVCFVCKLPQVHPECLPPAKADPIRMTFKNRDGGNSVIACGDRFLWNTFKWYVLDFVEQDKDVVVRLEGTADVAILPELLVGELVEEFNLSTMLWR